MPLKTAGEGKPGILTSSLFWSPFVILGLPIKQTQEEGSRHQLNWKPWRRCGGWAGIDWAVEVRTPGDFLIFYMITKVPLHSFLLQFAAFQATPVERASSLTKKNGGWVLVVEEGEQKQRRKEKEEMRKMIQTMAQRRFKTQQRASSSEAGWMWPCG